MKKFNLFVLTMMIVFTIALPACAETAQPGVNAFFDWSYLATYSGAVDAVVFIVQFLKLPIDRLGHIPTRERGKKQHKRRKAACIKRSPFCIFGCIIGGDTERAPRDARFAPQHPGQRATLYLARFGVGGVLWTQRSPR